MSNLPDPALLRALELEGQTLSTLTSFRPESSGLKAWVQTMRERHEQRLLELTARLDPAAGAAGPRVVDAQADRAVGMDAQPTLTATSARLVAARQLTPTVRELDFLAGATFDYQPGQYMKLQAPIDGRVLARSYSIARCTPDRGAFTLWVKRAAEGGVSAWLHAIPVGAVLRFAGPRGGFTLRPPAPTTRRVVFVGTGTGLAPLFALLEALMARTDFRGEIDVLWGVRSEREVFYEDVLNGMRAMRPGVSVTICLSEPEGPSPRPHGFVTEQLWARPDSWLIDAEFYLAGNGQMIRDVAALLGARGVDAARIYTEAFFSS